MIPLDGGHAHKGNITARTQGRVEVAKPVQYRTLPADVCHAPLGSLVSENSMADLEPSRLVHLAEEVSRPLRPEPLLVGGMVLHVR